MSLKFSILLEGLWSLSSKLYAILPINRLFGLIPRKDDGRIDWQVFLPGTDEPVIVTRIKELEEQAGTLPKIFSFLIAAWIGATAETLPIPYIPNSQKILVVALLIGAAYVYKDRRKRLQKRAKEKAEEVKTKASQSQSSIADFRESEDNNED